MKVIFERKFVEYSIKDNIIYEDENLIVVNKISYLPTVPLKHGNDKYTLLDAISEYCKDVKSFSGYNSHEGGILHRLDTPTSGLVLAAKNKETFEFLYSEQKKNNFKKTYLVKSSKSPKLLEGFFEFPYKNVIKNENVIIESLFRHYGKGRKCVRPVMDSYSRKIIDKASKTKYKTTVNFIKKSEDFYYFSCSLTNGFRHQIRCHLAWSGYPLVGDELYGGTESDQFGLKCNSITFINPLTNKIQTVSIEDEI